MFCYQVAAYRRSEGIDSVVVFGSPVDTRGTLSFGHPGGGGDQRRRRSSPSTSSRPAASRPGSAAPASGCSTRRKSLRQRLQFVRQLHDREALLPRERQRRFLEAEGWVAWPGPALADVIRQFGVHNRLVSGGFVIEDRLVTLADMTCPIARLRRRDRRDRARPLGARGALGGAALRRLRGDAEGRALRPRRRLDRGRGDLADGRRLAALARRRRGAARERRADRGRARARRRPSRGRSTGSAPARSSPSAPGSAPSRRSAAPRSARPGRSASCSATRAGRSASSTASDRVGAGTRISFGLLLDEQAERAPEDVVLLFEDRAHTQRRGQGAGRQRRPRPARDRRPPGRARRRADADPAERADRRRRAEPARRGRGADAPRRRPRPRGRARQGAADHRRPPERRARRRPRPACQVYVLGGGGKRPQARPGPDRHGADRPRRRRASPPGTGPTPGRAGDLAFILFTGSGRAHARQPDHQPALGALGVRHRLLGGADRAATRSTRPRPSTTPRRC